MTQRLSEMVLVVEDQPQENEDSLFALKVSNKAKKMREIAKIAKTENESKILKVTDEIARFKLVMGNIEDCVNVTAIGKIFNDTLDENVADLKAKLEKNSKLEQDTESKILKILKES